MRVLLLFLAFALGQNATTELRPDWAVIFQDASAATLLQQCNRHRATAPEAYWAPDAKTINDLESTLGPTLQRAIDREFDERQRKPAAEYYRQYGGIVVGGRRVVYVNGFHKLYLQLFGGAQSPPRPSWKERAVNVCDGGALFFGADYDFETRSVLNIRFNRQ